MRRRHLLLATGFITAIIVLLTTAMPSLALSSLAVRDQGNGLGTAVGLARVSAPAGTGVISGVVYFDADGDGTRGIDETGLVEGAQVSLSGGPAGSVSMTLTTGPDGSYQFTGLDAGTYVVAEAAPPGYVITSLSAQTITLLAGATANGVDFGDTLPFTITGVVFNDKDGNGIQVPSEPGIQGIPVELYDDQNANSLVDPTDSLLTSTETDASGVYVFHDVLPGYRVLRIQPPGGATSPSGTQAPLRIVSYDGGMGVNEFQLHFPLIASTDPAPACAFNTYILSNFNGTAIPAGRTVWFTARLKAFGLPSAGTTVYFENGEIQFGANKTSYHLAPARGKVVFSPTATGGTTTTYDSALQTWTTTVSPGNWDKEIFLTGLAYVVPSPGLPGGINPVTWNGRLSGTKAGVTLEWKWAAAVYTSFPGDGNLLGVKPVSSNSENPYNNGDDAGTPESYKAGVTAGARGGGGSNYTGGATGTVRGLCITPAVPPYEQRANCGSVSFTDTNGQTWSADRKYTLGGWGYLAGGSKSASGAVDGTNDDFLYLKYREKPVEYRFTVPNGTYDVTLKFAEFSTQTSSERVARITMEGNVVESAFSILAVAKKKSTALDRTYQVDVKDGLLNIVFDRSDGSSKDPIVSGIQVLRHPMQVGPPPTATHTPTPTATPTDTPAPTATPLPFVQTANAGSTTYTDANGDVWMGDQAYKVGSWGYTGGSAKASQSGVLNTSEDGLYRTYRENPHEYRFTVPNGTYDVLLKFADFTATGPNDRLMKISIEGQTVESSLSVWADKPTAVDKAYTVSVSDGVLNISFVKVSGSNKEPIVSAIKVIKQ